MKFELNDVVKEKELIEKLTISPLQQERIALPFVEKVFSYHQKVFLDLYSLLDSLHLHLLLLFSSYWLLR